MHQELAYGMAAGRLAERLAASTAGQHVLESTLFAALTQSTRGNNTHLFEVILCTNKGGARCSGSASSGTVYSV